MRDAAYWERIVRGSTRGLTDEQVRAAAEMCLQTEKDTGASCGAWHAAAAAVGRPERCCCAHCRPDIKRFA